MTLPKAAGFVVLGALLAVIALYPLLKQTRREQEWGLVMTPEDVMSVCGRPQSDNIYTLTYIQGDKHIELRFYGMNHRMFLQHVKWNSNREAGDINQVSRAAIDQYVASGALPACLSQAAK
jgi:hypothetical protein